MDNRDKVRGALRGLLFACVLSALLWGAIVGVFMILRPSPIQAEQALAWWQLPWVRYGAAITIAAMIVLATVGEIIRLRTKRRLANTDSVAPWPLAEPRQPERVAATHHAPQNAKATQPHAAPDDVVHLP